MSLFTSRHNFNIWLSHRIHTNLWLRRGWGKDITRKLSELPPKNGLTNYTLNGQYGVCSQQQANNSVSLYIIFFDGLSSDISLEAVSSPFREFSQRRQKFSSKWSLMWFPDVFLTCNSTTVLRISQWNKSSLESGLE